MNRPRLIRWLRIAVSAVCVLVIVRLIQLWVTGFLASPTVFHILLFAALAFVPWLPWHKLRWHYSLRTLLIVTTLVAMVLGVVVWAVR